MIVTDFPYVILHMPRCAGSTIRWAIINAGYKYKFSCEHAPIAALPKRYANMPRIGFIRNPLTWYSSWYHYKQGSNMSVFIKGLTDNYQRSFCEFVARAVDLQKTFRMEPHVVDQIKAAIIETSMNRYTCWINYMFEDIKDLDRLSSTSLFGFWFKQVGLHTATVFRIEDGVTRAFDMVAPGHRITMVRKNAGEANHAEMHSDKTISMISRADQQYMDRFNYTTEIQ